MEGIGLLGDDLPIMPERLFERLAQLPGYVWDETLEPFHSTYDNWQVFGFRHVTGQSSSSNHSTNPPSHRTSSTNGSPKPDHRPSFRHHWSSISDADSSVSSPKDSDNNVWQRVVARISTSQVRLEREFSYNKVLIQTLDPEGKHTLKPIELTRLASTPGEAKPILVAIFEKPGPNYLRELLSFGPAHYGARGRQGSIADPQPVALQTVLDFGIGAAETLELLHHGARVVHGEIRADSFHYHRETRSVRLVNTGNGPKAFENTLSSEGWSMLNQDIGGKNKLQYMAPEQTGRLAVEPDTRTDIYSLGILLYYMLTGKPAVAGETAIEIVQKVLSGRIPHVSNHRMDVPKAISQIVAKMTARSMEERYQSVSGVRHDLVAVSRLLGEGDVSGLDTFKVASRDVSSFFILPGKTFGRQKERVKIIDVVEKAHQRLHSTISKIKASKLYSISSNSSVSDRLESVEALDAASSDSSSLGFDKTRSNSVSAHLGVHGALDSPSTGRGSTNGNIRPNGHLDHLMEHGSSYHSSVFSSTQDSLGSSSFSRRRNSHEPSKKMGRCDVLVLTGAQGSGKTHLIQNVQISVRKHSYFTLASFDRARPAPFEPLVKAISSLLRQIFSERDVGTPYHESVRSNLSPIWAVLHVMLNLPENLLARSTALGVNGAPKPPKRVIKADLPGIAALASRSGASAQAISQARQDFLRGASSGKAEARFMNAYLDVLRIISRGKLLCICLDDFHAADEESVELVSNIIRARLSIVLILAGRDDPEASLKAKHIMQSGYTTLVNLSNLGEDDVFAYVAETLHRDQASTLPLAAVVYEKSEGNPFLIRHILQTCYQKNCIWYDWRASGWEYDLDRVFAEFSTEQLGCLTNNFITKRFGELPMAARAILSWGSLLGTSFSYSLVEQLLSGEFSYFSSSESESERRFDVTCPKMPALYHQESGAVIEGLQVLISQHILLPGDTDDEFRFTHDRYARAALMMSESCKKEKMHFIIAKTLMKYGGIDKSELRALSQHICQSQNLIKQMVQDRVRYRDILTKSAEQAIEASARPTALTFYKAALELLQDDPWDEQKSDCFYDETLALFTQVAELSFLLGESSKALSLLSELFAHARTSECKTRPWILQSRIFAARGDGQESLLALISCMSELGVDMRELTWEQCDVEYRRLRQEVLDIGKEKLTSYPLSKDPQIIALGTVMAEAVGAGFWTDALMFYRFSIHFLDIHLHRGVPAQIGLAYSHIAMVSIGRFSDLEFALYASEISMTLCNEVHKDVWTMGRGGTVYALFVGHCFAPFKQMLIYLENALENSYTSGDRMISLMSLGAMAVMRLFVGQDQAEIETFCSYGPDDFEGWQSDQRGGNILIAVRQVSRALQGKTFNAFPQTTLSDDSHDSEQYLKELSRTSSTPERPRDIYLALGLIAWYQYGHHKKVVEVGTELLKTLDSLWTVPHVASARFYLGLSTLALCYDDGSEEGKAKAVALARECKSFIEKWTKLSDVNYVMWVQLLDAEIHSILGDSSTAAGLYEAAIDHSQVHGFALEEALATELQANFFIRQGAKRAGRIMLQEAIGGWNRINCGGKARYLTEKHEWLLKTATTARAMDVAVQTDEALGDMPVGRDVSLDKKNELTAAWANNAVPIEGGQGEASELPGLGLDILDLSSILEFSHVISSELQVDKLLYKMTEILLESVGGQADFVAIVIESDDNGWCVAASGDSDRGVKTYADGLPFEDVDDQVAQQITHYILRFKEVVFTHNILDDDRFSSVSDAYLARNPSGRSIIGIPILQADHLMGVIHIEGAPNSFTQRNLIVLNLLTNQVSISLGNALLYRKVRKVSAANASMVESQKRALATAKAAEVKAKKAEAEAKENVRLKDEAMNARSIFLANVSHELRTPLNGVIGMSELLKSSTLDREQEGYADSIRLCADSLLVVINDILDYSRLEAQRMRLFEVPLNLKETIAEVVRAIAYTNRERGLQFIEDLQLDEDLVLGDPVRLHQVLMNLLSNSAKFTAQGSITIAAKIIKRYSDRVKVQVSVADTGIGITKEQLTRLFKPFSQADNSTQRSYGGSGLGLSICKAMIEDLMHGEIEMTSEPGVGTKVTFTVTFSRAPLEPEAGTIEATSHKPDPMANWSQDTGLDGQVAPSRASFCDLTQIPRSEIRVCVAEDNPVNQKIATSFVKKMGLKCEAFSDGKQAVEALQKKAKESEPYHIVLMDCQMPVMDGYEATRTIRKDEDPNVRDVLIIAMTASAIRGDREKCLDAGMNNYLAKPVRANVLNAMVDEYLMRAPTQAPNLQNPNDDLAQTGKQPDIVEAAQKDPSVKPLLGERTSPHNATDKPRKSVRKIKARTSEPSGSSKQSSPSSPRDKSHVEWIDPARSAPAVTRDSADVSLMTEDPLEKPTGPENHPLAKFKHAVGDSGDSTEQTK